METAMTNYKIATILSFITACFTCASSWSKKPSRSYYFQVAQCLVYSAAAWFYGVYACTVMMLINALRNYLVASGRYGKWQCVVFSILALGLGLWSNTSGITGLLTVAAVFCVQLSAEAGDPGKDQHYHQSFYLAQL